MATIKVNINSITPHTKGRYSLDIELLHRGETRKIHTPYYLSEHNFDPFLERVVACPYSGVSKKEVFEINEYLSIEIERLYGIINHLDTVKGDYPMSDVLEMYGAESYSRIVANYVEDFIRIKVMKRSKAMLYMDLLEQLLSFNGLVEPLFFDSITDSWLKKFRKNLTSLGYKESAVYSYHRMLQCICENARSDGFYTVDPDPFQNECSKTCDVVEPTLHSVYLSKIRRAKLSDDPQLEFTRDLYLFSCLTNGMSFKDMAFLQNKNLHAGYFSYYRNQAVKHLTNIKITPDLHRILKKYKNDGVYLFPIFDNSGIAIKDQYRIHLLRYNRRLKELSSVLGISCKPGLKRELWNQYRINSKMKVAVSPNKKTIVSSSDTDLKQHLVAALEKPAPGHALTV